MSFHSARYFFFVNVVGWVPCSDEMDVNDLESSLISVLMYGHVKNTVEFYCIYKLNVL